MRESSIVVRPEPMESATYTQSSRLQAAGLLPAVALFERAAEQVPLPHRRNQSSSPTMALPPATIR